MIVPTSKQIFAVIFSLIGLMLMMGFGLSIAVNYGVKLMEQRSGNFLPGGQAIQNPAQP